MSRHWKILYLNVKNVLTKKEKKQKTVTRKSVIEQFRTTGREGSARNVERRRSVYQIWKEKREKSAKTKIRHSWRGNQSR